MDSNRDSGSQRFKVALSFPGEHRAFVEQVADFLAQKIGRDRVLYDKYYEAEFARPDLDTYLQGLYHNESELIAVFLCGDYERKEWCGLEWRAIRDLIKQHRGASVMLFCFDDTKIPGLFSLDGYVWIGDRTPEEAVDLILQRYALNAESGPVRLKAESATAQARRVAPPNFTHTTGSLFGREAKIAALGPAWADPKVQRAKEAEAAASPEKTLKASEQHSFRPPLSSKDLVALIQEREEPRMRGRLQRFCVQLEAAKGKIRALTSYKAAHEILHGFQFQGYQSLQMAAELSGTEEPRWRALADPLFDLGEVVRQLREQLANAPFQERQPAWFDTLDLARTDLEKALNHQDRATLWQSARILRQVFSLQLTVLSVELRKTARELQLKVLADSLSRILDLLGSSDGARAIREQLEPRKERLIELESYSQWLVGHHDTWQALDYNFRDLNDFLDGGDLSLLRVQWGQLREQIEQSLEQAERSDCRRVKEVIGNLDFALQSYSTNATFIAYRQVSRTVSTYFLKLDHRLKELGVQLEENNEPLYMLQEPEP